MTRTLRRALVVTHLLAVWAGVAAVSQEPILEFSLDREEVMIQQGGEAIALLRVDNPSVYQGDDIEPIVDTEGIALEAEPEEIKALAPFDGATIALRLSADETVPLGRSTLPIEIIYSYCIGEVCFQFSEELSLLAVIEPPSEVPIEIPVVLPVETTSPNRFRLGALSIGAVLLAVAVVARRTWAVRWPLYVVLGVFAIGGLAYGIALDQHEQAQGIGAVLCTSCVGIERAQRGEPELSAAGVAAVEGVDSEIELLVFFAEWCHACPYAEAMVEKVAGLNGRITYRLVDVDVESRLAEESGVVRSGRTVVPAILRVDTGEIVFGAEGLEARLLGLLGVGS